MARLIGPNDQRHAPIPAGAPRAPRDDASAPAAKGRRDRSRQGAGSDSPERQRRVIALYQLIRRDLAEAREAVSMLRDELASVARANAEPAYAMQGRRFAYAAKIREELTAAETRLVALRERRQEVMRELRRVREASATTATRIARPTPDG